MTLTRDLDERFQTGAQKYSAYLETPEGRLRTDIAFAHLQEFLPPTRPDHTRVLDVGCGTGAIGVRLARLGCQVTLLDSSQPMLEIARRAAEQAGVQDRVTIHHGKVSDMSRCPAASFETVVCHNILEFLDEPCTVLRECARVLRKGSSILSIVTRNQAGEVLRSALNAGDLRAADANITAEWGYESLYGEKVRLFEGESLLTMLQAQSFEVVAVRGIRVIADYLPSSISRVDEYEQILKLEMKLGRRPEFAGIARYIQVLARLREAGR